MQTHPTPQPTAPTVAVCPNVPAGNNQIRHPADITEPPPVPRWWYVVTEGAPDIYSQSEFDLLDSSNMEYFAVKKFKDWAPAFKYYSDKYFASELFFVPPAEVSQQQPAAAIAAAPASVDEDIPAAPVIAGASAVPIACTVPDIPIGPTAPIVPAAPAITIEPPASAAATMAVPVPLAVFPVASMAPSTNATPPATQASTQPVFPESYDRRAIRIPNATRPATQASSQTVLPLDLSDRRATLDDPSDSAASVIATLRENQGLLWLVNHPAFMYNGTTTGNFHNQPIFVPATFPSPPKKTSQSDASGPVWQETSIRAARSSPTSSSSSTQMKWSVARGKGKGKGKAKGKAKAQMPDVVRCLDSDEVDALPWAGYPSLETSPRLSLEPTTSEIDAVASALEAKQNDPSSPIDPFSSTPEHPSAPAVTPQIDVVMADSDTANNAPDPLPIDFRLLSAAPITPVRKRVERDGDIPYERLIEIAGETPRYQTPASQKRLKIIEQALRDEYPESPGQGILTQRQVSVIDDLFQSPLPSSSFYSTAAVAGSSQAKASPIKPLYFSGNPSSQNVAGSQARK